MPTRSDIIAELFEALPQVEDFPLDTQQLWDAFNKATKAKDIKLRKLSQSKKVADNISTQLKDTIEFLYPKVNDEGKAALMNLIEDSVAVAVAKAEADAKEEEYTEAEAKDIAKDKNTLEKMYEDYEDYLEKKRYQTEEQQEEIIDQYKIDFSSNIRQYIKHNKEKNKHNKEKNEESKKIINDFIDTLNIHFLSFFEINLEFPHITDTFRNNLEKIIRTFLFHNLHLLTFKTPV